MSSIFESLFISGGVNTTVFVMIVLNFIFATTIYIHGQRKSAEIFYALIAFFISMWSIATLIIGGNPSLYVLDVAVRWHYVAGQMAYLSFFWFSIFYLKRTLRSWILPICILILNIAASIIVCLPAHFFQIVQVSSMLSERMVFNSGWHLFYTLVLGITFFTTEVLLITKRKSVEPIDKTRIAYVIVGTTVGGSLGLVSNVILPATGVYFWFPIGPILVTVFFTTLSLYAVLKYKLFDLKVIVTEILVFVLWLVILTRMLIAQTAEERLVNLGLLVATVITGIFLIRSVIKEVRLREQVEKLAKDLELSNEQQANLIHFISHEVKGFLTKSRNIFSLVLEGDYGPLPEYLKMPAEEGLRSGTNGVEMVQEILGATNFKKGTVVYKSEPFNLKQVLESVCDELKKNAVAKGLSFETDIANENFEMVGDAEQVRHALKNLVDNSIKYTPHGSIHVSLQKSADKFLFSVKDTGVGIDPADRPNLWTEGVRGKDALKTNVDSTGFGLFIVKKIIEVHKGRVWVESEGPGHGSTFFAELPQK